MIYNIRYIASLTSTIHQLIRVIEEQSELAALSGPAAGIAALTQESARLYERLNTLETRLRNENPAWIGTLEDGERAALFHAMGDLRTALAVNAALLRAQITQSSEALKSMSRDLRRMAGRERLTGWAACGDMIATLAASIEQGSWN